SPACPELPRELHDHAARLRASPAEEPVRLLTIVEHHEETRARRAEPTEARVRRPHAILIVELHERLREHPRREEVRDAAADQAARERALVEVHVIVIEEERR